MATKAEGPRVLMFGAGDAGLKTAAMLLQAAPVARLALADFTADALRRETVALLGDCHGCDVALVEVDGRDHAAVAGLIKAERPDLVVQMASLISPWSIIGRDHPAARALASAGLGIQLPCQLPILINVMRAVRDLGLDAPVANLSAPDITHPVLAARSLAPTVGLGNVSIMQLRARAALIRREGAEAGRGALMRLIGTHAQVYGVMQARMPDDPADAVQVFLGEDGRREDGLAYAGAPVVPGPAYNIITAGACVPVLAALLPGAAPIRFSAPAPDGLIGGYPLTIGDRSVSLDLPASVSLEEAHAYNARIARADGIGTIEADGTVIFTEEAVVAVAGLDPRLAEPLGIDDLPQRARLLQDVIAGMNG